MSWGDDTRTQRAVRLLRTFTADPLRVSRALPGEFRQAYGSAGYRGAEADEAWEEHLHSLLGAAWPCGEGQHLQDLMSDVGALLGARGWGFGRDNTYGWYADADSSLCRAVWCTVIHAQPEVVVETGVAHGVTSRIVLEALRQNDRGHLWSIDLPFPFDHRLHAETGAAVTDACRDRWSYLEGSSRQRLPSLVAELGHVELFIHDSLHTARNTVFEMQQTASRMPPGGVMLVDDISMHAGFAGFARRNPGYRTLVCQHADRSSLFGIAVNAGSSGTPVLLSAGPVLAKWRRGMATERTAERSTRLLPRLRHVLRDDLDQGQRAALASWISFSATFAGVRGITYSIRAGKGPFRNISAGGEHLHHYMWGIAMLAGVGAVAVHGDERYRNHPVVATSYGSGLALIVDEFALLLDLKDVYWAKQGRLSVDVGIGGIAAAGSYFAALPVMRAMRERRAAEQERHYQSVP